MFQIDFFYKKNKKNFSEEKVKSIIVERFLHFGFELGLLAIHFVTDDALREINIQYKNKEYFTDIITLDYSQKPLMSGEMYISTERVEENAKQFNVSFETELLRVLFHGALHLTGLNDRTQEEKKVMRETEDELLTYYKKS